MFTDLDIEPDVLPPYSPEKKPFIERFFGTLTRGLLAYLPGFAGHDVAQRQAIRARRSFAERRGESEADAFQVELPAAELQARIDAWIETIYEREPHDGLDGRTPFEVAAGQPVRRIENERALDILLAPRRAAATSGESTRAPSRSTGGRTSRPSSRRSAGSTSRSAWTRAIWASSTSWRAT